MEVTTGVAVGDPCAVEVGGRRHEVGDRFMPIGFSIHGRLRAPAAVAGYGITAPGYETQRRHVEVEQNGVTLLNADLRSAR